MTFVRYMLDGSRPKLLVVKWLGLRVTVRLRRVRAGDREWTSLLYLKK